MSAAEHGEDVTTAEALRRVIRDDDAAALEARIESKKDRPPRPSSMSIVRYTLEQRCDQDVLNIEDTQETVALGRVCIHCGRSVAVRVVHYGRGRSDFGSDRQQQ